MLLNHLSLSENASSETVKSALMEKLGQVLPQGSYNVVLRSYQGDFRARSTNKINYKAMILLDAEARKIAIEHKNEIEAMGFRVSSSGDIQLN